MKYTNNMSYVSPPNPEFTCKTVKPLEIDFESQISINIGEILNDRENKEFNSKNESPQ